MTQPIHTRQEKWEGWPFRSVADVAEFVGDLLAMVEEAAGSTPHLSANVTYADRGYELKSLAQLREMAPGLGLGDMHGMSAMVFWSWGESRPVAANFNLEGGAYERSTRLSVSGTKVTAVDGVNVGAVAAVNRWAERTRAEEEAEAAEMAEAAEAEAKAAEATEAVRPDLGPPPTPTLDPQPAWKRLLAHPYAVQIIGGVVAGIILLIAGVVFSIG